MLLELNYLTSLHAACIALNGTGVLLFGESGVGKSTLTYACARRGWTYISDDASSVVRDAGRTVIGEPHHFRFRAEAPDLFPELRGQTVGHELDRKPTIEVLTEDLPIRTAPECRVDYVAFLDRRPGSRASMTRIEKEQTRERIQQDMPAFDSELDAPRRKVAESMAEAPAFQLCYSDYADAALLLEQIVRGGAA
jgi:hypothetical protein